MTEPVEVAIESALLTRARAFATAQSLTIALPNVAFTAPLATPTAHYLEAHFLPAPTNGLGLSTDSTNQHYGLLQISVYCGLGGGEYAPARIASAAIAYFKYRTAVTKDGFIATVWKQPYRGPAIKDATWLMIPVTIPYVCFAPNPA